MKSYDLDLILRGVDLKRLAEQAGARFRKNASHCPIHRGDNPHAFRIYANGKRWHCFTRCPQEANDGDALRFYMLWKGVGYREALGALGGSAVPSPAAKPDGNGAKPPIDRDRWESRAQAFMAYARVKLDEGEVGAKARQYLRAERGLREETWQRFQLGLNPHPLSDAADRWGLAKVGQQLFLPRGLVIPRFYRGRLKGIKIRRVREGESLAKYLPAEPGKAGKFSSLRGSQHGLFGYETWLGYAELLLVEGEWDCLLAWQEAGDLCDVGTLGSAGQGLCAVQEELELYAYRRLVVVYDSDTAGEIGRQKFEHIARASCASPPAHDLTDYWKQGGDLKKWVRETVIGEAARG